MKKEHIKNPEKLSCSSFKSTLRKYTPLHTTEKSFNKSTLKICECFSRQNPKKESMSFVTQSSLDICAKPYIEKWIVPRDIIFSNQQKTCLKNKVYIEVRNLILLKQKEAHDSHFFKNDLFKYEKPIDWDSVIQSCL